MYVYVQSCCCCKSEVHVEGNRTCDLRDELEKLSRKSLQSFPVSFVQITPLRPSFAGMPRKIDHSQSVYLLKLLFFFFFLSASNVLLSSLWSTVRSSSVTFGALALVCACKSPVQQGPDVWWRILNAIYGVRCIYACVHTYSLCPHLEVPVSDRSQTGMLTGVEIIHILLDLLQQEQNDMSSNPRKPRNKKRVNARMLFVSAEGAVGFVVFLGVVFSLPFSLASSCSVCLRGGFIPCTAKILLWAFPILVFHSAFWVPVFCPRDSFIHVCVLNGLILFY